MLGYRRKPPILIQRGFPRPGIARGLKPPETRNRDLPEIPSAPPKREVSRLYHGLGFGYHPPGYSRIEEVGAYGIRHAPLVEAENCVRP